MTNNFDKKEDSTVDEFFCWSNRKADSIIDELYYWSKLNKAWYFPPSRVISEDGDCIILCYTREGKKLRLYVDSEHCWAEFSGEYSMDYLKTWIKFVS